MQINRVPTNNQSSQYQMNLKTNNQASSLNRQQPPKSIYSKPSDNLLKSIQKSRKENINQNEVQQQQNQNRLDNQSLMLPFQQTNTHNASIDYSQQFILQKCEYDNASYLKSGFTNSAQQSYILSQKPKEIEDLFEQNFYMPNNSAVAAEFADKSLGQQLNYKKVGLSGFKQQNSQINQSIVLGDKTMSLNLEKYSSVSMSHKKQAPTGRIEKKMCNDDDTQAYNTRITHKNQQLQQYQNLKDQLQMNEEANSQENSINSLLSDSPDIESSLQKHANENTKSSKVLNPFNSNSVNYQTIQSAISSVQQNQTNNIQRNVINISQSLNQRALSGLQSVINQANIAVKDLKANLGENKMQNYSKQNNGQIASLDALRYQQKVAKFQNNQENLTAKNQFNKTQAINLSNQKPQSANKLKSTQQINQKLHTAIKSQHSRQNMQHSLPLQMSQGRPTPHAKISLCFQPKNSIQSNVGQNFNHSQMPKIQDKPQLKKIRDESDEETIDSQDMSSSLIEQDKRKSQDKQLQNQALLNTDNSHKNESKLKLRSQDSNRELFSFNEGLLGSQQSNSLAQIQTIDNRFGESTGRVGTKSSIADPLAIINALQNAAYRSTSSANKRARWDLSGGRSTLQNSYRKNSDSDVNPKENSAALLKVHKTQDKTIDQSTTQYEQLQQQYLAIKKQMKEFKMLQCTQDMRQSPIPIDRQSTTKVEDILSPDKSSNDSECEEHSYDLKKCDKGQTKNKHMQTAAKIQKKRKSNNHFKSLDVQFLPQILKTSLKQEQSPQISKFLQSITQTEQKECRYQECGDETITKLKKKLAFDLQNLENLGLEDQLQLTALFNQQKTNFAKTSNSILKSQLQIGLRKLSENRQLRDIESTLHQQYQDSVQKVKSTNKRKSSSKNFRNSQEGFLQSQTRLGKHGRNLSKEYYQQSKHKRKVSNSQVSFVGVDSCSSDDYKDCRSQAEKSRMTTRKEKFRKQKSIESRSSSRYYLAQENRSERSCSCCREEMTQKRNKKIDHENTGRKKSQREKSQRFDRKEKSTMEENKHKEVIHRQKSNTIYTQRTDKSKRLQSQEKSKYIDNENSHYKNQASKKNEKSSRKQNQSSRYEKNQSTQRNKKNSDQTPKSTQKSSQKMNSVMINPWLPGAINTGLEAASMNILQQQLALAQQLQAPLYQNQAYLQPILNTQPNMINMSQMLNMTGTNFQQNPSLISSLPLTKLNSPSSHAILARAQQQQNFQIQNQKQQLVLNSQENYKSLEKHQEQIEAIEMLIKEAKSKLENNIISNQNNSCRLIESTMSQRSNRNQNRAITQSIKEEIEYKNKIMMNQRPKGSRNETALIAASSYNSNLEGNQHNHLLFRTQNSQTSNRLLNDNQSAYDLEQNRFNYNKRRDQNLEDDQFEEINNYHQNFNKTENKKQQLNQMSLSHRRGSDQTDFKIESKFGGKIRDTKRQNYQHEPQTQKNIHSQSELQFQYSSQRKRLNREEEFDDKSQGQFCQEFQSNSNRNHYNGKKLQNCEENQPSLVLNQSLSSINTHLKPSNSELKEFQSNQNLQENPKNALWIDFNEDKSQKASLQKLKDQKKGKLNTNKQLNKLSQDNFPQSIPEEKDDEFCSPDNQLNQQFAKRGVQKQNKAVRLDFPNSNTQSSESILVNSKRLKSQQNQNIQRETAEIDNNFQIKPERVSIQNKAQKEAWAMDFTDKPKSPMQKEQADSIAEAFKNRMQNMEQRFKKNSGSDNQTDEQLPDKQLKKQYTKAELLERKKALLQEARNKLKKSQQQKQEIDNLEDQNKDEPSKADFSNKSREFSLSMKNSQKSTARSDNKDVPAHLLTRLSQGQRPEISKKDMLKLTSRNYEQLPEIKQKKIDSSKKDDLLQRIANVKELEKKRRQTIVKKQQLVQQQNLAGSVKQNKLPPSVSKLNN
eukprot:403345451